MTTQTSHHGVLRFITAGSVDDGKSTLIGRLLYDSKSVLSDQLTALTNAKNKRTSGEAIDFSLLTDGLEAEREQGITIDVAYRYFSTANRKFIIADTPGHEQYTRNMVTGASTAHAAIVLIDVTRVDFSGEKPVLLPQTKRHSAILKLLELPHVIVAVNKMDLAAYSEATFQAICGAYAELAEQLGLKDVRYVPVSALRGDNIVHPSAEMPWYTGEQLLPMLEGLPTTLEEISVEPAVLRFPVQLVVRQDGSSADDFRGYAGRVELGSVQVGQAVKVQPAGYATTVAEILGPNGNLQTAKAGEVVTVRLADDVDVSRGDALVAADTTPLPAKKLEADLCWFDADALNTARKYVLKHTTASVFARVGTVDRVLDVHTLSHPEDRRTISMNDIGRVQISLQKPIVCDSYSDNPATGAFVLIDEASNHTVAAGMIRAFS